MRPRPRPARIAALATIAAAVSIAAAAGGAARGPGPAASGPPDAARIAAARIYQGGKWVLPGQTPQTVGAALAQLAPSYVSSLVRFQAGEAVTNKEVAAFNTVRDAVLAANPDAKFAIELNGLEYPSAKKVKAMMSRVRARFDNDGWLFDFYTPAAARKPKVMEAAVRNAHANGEFLGGNAFGIAKHPKIPPGTDYLAVQDTNFRIDLKAVRALAKRATVFFHLANAPQNPKSDGCVWIEKLSTKKRKAYLARRARQQATYDFRLAYPVFFPECQRKRSTPNPAVFAYDAPQDTPVFEAIGGLMERYDGAPAG